MDCAGGVWVHLKYRLVRLWASHYFNNARNVSNVIFYSLITKYKIQTKNTKFQLNYSIFMVSGCSKVVRDITSRGSSWLVTNHTTIRQLSSLRARQSE